MRTNPTRRLTWPAIASLVIALVGVPMLAGCGSSSHEAAPTTTAGSAAQVLNKALAELVNRQTAQAQADFEQVIRLDPKNKYAFYNLGYIAQTAGKRSEAETQYRLALAIDPAYGPALYNLAILRTADGAPAEAIELYRKAIAANPNDANSHYNLGLLLRRTGKTDEGNDQVRQAVAIDPSLADAAVAQGVPDIPKS